MDLPLPALGESPTNEHAGAPPPPDLTRPTLVARIERAETVDAAFGLAREEFPLGVDYPRPVRSALFERSARDHNLGKSLLCRAGRDQDLVQEVLLYWWETGIDHFDPSKGAVRTYLYRVLLNRIINERRKARRRGQWNVAAPEEVVQRACESYFDALDVETIARVSAALDEEKPEHALAWVLSKIPRCSNEEIAAITGINVGSVSREVERVNRRLRERFGDRDLALLALFPAMFVERSGLEVWGRDLAARVRAGARRALRSSAGGIASYGLAALVGAGIAVTLRPTAPPRVVTERVEVRVPQRVEVPIALPASASAASTPPAAAASAPIAAPTPAPHASVARASSAEESLALQRISALTVTQPGTALARLAAHRRRWPSSQHALMRDALEAEALARVGRRERAQALARRVIARSPQSSEAFRLRSAGLGETAP